MFRQMAKVAAAGLVGLVVAAGVASCGVPHLACIAGPCAVFTVLGAMGEGEDDGDEGMAPVGEDDWHTVRSYGE